MTRPAPSAARALAILDFLAAHPTEAFTLTEIAQELGVNLASTHAVLGSMADAGYLVRHPTHKTYRLGPSVVAVGHAALVSHPVIEVAREEMQRIAVDTGLECLAAAPFEMELVAVAQVGPTTTQQPLIRVGQRLPLVPPLGIMYVAWSDQERIDDWLSRAAPTEPRGSTGRYLRALESARALGFSVGVIQAGRQTAILPIKGDPGTLDFGTDTHPRVSYIAASIFDERSDVSLVISLTGFDRACTAQEIVNLGYRLRNSAEAVTRAVHGSPPVYDARSA